jgi:hypothetical protein
MLALHEPFHGALLDAALTATDAAAPTTSAACPTPVFCLQGQAEAHFPHLEEPSGIVLNLTDTEGTQHSFRFRFWINNQSRCPPPATVTPCRCG